MVGAGPLGVKSYRTAMSAIRPVHRRTRTSAHSAATSQKCHERTTDQGGVRPPGRPLLPRPYAFRKASRSALIVSASVVGMPCGKPL
jgi:hypothetical protein